MKCAACQYEYILEIDGETDTVEKQVGDEGFMFLGTIVFTSKQGDWKPAAKKALEQIQKE